MPERPAYIDRALKALFDDRDRMLEARKKFEPGGNLYALIEESSPAAKERLAQIKIEINQLSQAISFLEEQ